ncbi:hypothetical protein B0H10DRAFT_2135439, partial [Mycena sp. CBHHK59/15]
GAWRSRPRPYTTTRAANERIAAHGVARGGDGDERERVATAARCVICAQWRHTGGGADGAGMRWWQRDICTGSAGGQRSAGRWWGRRVVSMGVLVAYVH